MPPELKETVELILCQDKQDLADKAAKFFASQVKQVLENKEKCYVALSGGSTPSLLYGRLLSSDLSGAVPWERCEFFVSDERCVEHESKDSNWGNASRQLFQPLKLAASGLHPTEEQDKSPENSAIQYEALIKKLLPQKHGLPCFDIVFLGMGPDGHTASLFPQSPALLENDKLVCSNYVEKLKSKRISFTFKLINNASRIIFLVAGADKAEALSGVLQEKTDIYPSERVKASDGTVYWFVEKEAAAKLKL